MAGARFKDPIQIKGKESAILMIVISLDSALQRGAQWADFLELVDRCFIEKTLSKLIIVTTGHLQRHYFSLELEKPLEEKEIEKKALALDREWLEKQSHILDKLNISIEIIDWKDLLNKSIDVNSRSFNDFFQLIKSDYANNKEFKNIVDKHADGYVSRKILKHCKGKAQFDRNQFHQVAIDYALEECAAIQQLFRCGADLLAYPHGKNPPANYIWNKYFKNEPLRYVRYETKNLEVNKNPSSFFQPTRPTNLIIHYVQWALNTINWNISQQFRFIRDFNQLLFSINTLEQSDSTPVTTKTHRNSI